MSKIALDKINELVRADLKEKMGDWVGFTTGTSVQFCNKIFTVESYPCTVTVTSPNTGDSNDFLEAAASFDDCSMPYVSSVARSISGDITKNIIEWDDFSYRTGIAQQLAMFVFQRVDSYFIDYETIGFTVRGKVIDTADLWYKVERQG